MENKKERYAGLYSINPNPLPKLPPPSIEVIKALPPREPREQGTINPLRLSMDYIEVPLRFTLEKLYPWQIYLNYELSKPKPKGSVIFVQCVYNGAGATSMIKYMTAKENCNQYIDLLNLRTVNHVMHELLSRNVYPKNIFLDLRYARPYDPQLMEGIKSISDGLYSCTPKFSRTLVHEVENIVIFSPFIPREIVQIHPDLLNFYQLNLDNIVPLETMEVIKSLGYQTHVRDEPVVEQIPSPHQEIENNN